VQVWALRPLNGYSSRRPARGQFHYSLTHHIVLDLGRRGAMICGLFGLGTATYNYDLYQTHCPPMLAIKISIGKTLCLGVGHSALNYRPQATKQATLELSTL
jgi:hypothetical protein